MRDRLLSLSLICLIAFAVGARFAACVSSCQVEKVYILKTTDGHEVWLHCFSDGACQIKER
jgi:hypothetical protein